MQKSYVRDIVIDVCPVCNGVYYDRGELKKLFSGALDSDTILSRLPGDGSALACPECNLNMEKVSARKGVLYYEMYFCRSCLATFLAASQIAKIKLALGGLRPKNPSAFRPKTISKINTSVSGIAGGSGCENNSLRPSGAKKYDPAAKPAMVEFNTTEERSALEHYRKISRDYEYDAEEISSAAYIFCLLSNLPLEVYNPRYYFPYVLVGIIIANLLVFLVTLKLMIGAAHTGHNIFAPLNFSEKILRNFYDTLGLIPTEFFSFKSFLNLFSHQFVHGSLMHFVGNMYFLWIFGDNVCDIFYDYKNPVEREFSFLGFYLFTGVAGGIAHVLCFSGIDIPLVGASGAISGVMGAYLRLFPGARFYQIIFLMPFKIPAVYYIGLWVLGQVWLAFVLGPAANVSWPGHLGGFLAGYISISYFIPYQAEEING